MRTIKARISGEAQDVQAFCQFLHKLSDQTTALTWVSESTDYQNRNSVEIRRYLEVRFDEAHQ